MKPSPIRYFCEKLIRNEKVHVQIIIMSHKYSPAKFVGHDTERFIAVAEEVELDRVKRSLMNHHKSLCFVIDSKGKGLETHHVHQCFQQKFGWYQRRSDIT